MTYLGQSPQTGFESPAKDSFSGNNSTTSFTMSRSVGSPTQIDVFVDNVRQEPTTAYTVADKTLTFTGTPATGTNNIYVIHKQGGFSTGLIPTSGRDSDRVTTMTVDGDLNTKGNIVGNVLHPITLDGTDGSSSDAGDNLVLEGTDSSLTNAGDMILHEINTDDINKVGQVDTANFQFDNNVLVKGNVEVQGTFVAPTTGGRVTIESGTDATTGFLLLDSSAASTDVGEQILFEDGTNDPTSYYNNDLVAFSSDVKIGDEVTANSITAPTIRKNTASPSFTLPSADGTSGQAIITDASGNLSFGDAGGGKILQVQTVTKTDTFQSQSTSFTAVTGLSVNITPSATSSKVLILVHVNGMRATSNAYWGIISLFKGGSNMITEVGNREAGFNNGYHETSSNRSFNMENYNFTIVDSPNTTSQLTYDVRVKLTNSSDTYNINRATNDENSSGRPRGVSTITCLEIDGS